MYHYSECSYSANVYEKQKNHLSPQSILKNTFPLCHSVNCFSVEGSMDTSSFCVIKHYCGARGFAVSLTLFKPGVGKVARIEIRCVKHVSKLEGMQELV